MKAVVTENGHVTIPKVLRQKLGIKTGTVLDLHVEKATLIGIKISQSDAIKKVYGRLKLKMGTNKIVDKLRGKA